MKLYLPPYFSFKNRAFKIRFKKNFGFSPGNVEVYQMAFLHRSVAALKKVDNERLEFLGDSILSTVISEYLYNYYPKAKEGFLSKMRSRIVNRESLNNVAFRLNLDQWVEFDKTAKLSRESSPDIFGNALEAFIGAIYFDKGFKFTQNYILEELITKHMDIEKVKNIELNFKGRLFEICQKTGQEIKINIQESGSPKDTVYTAEVMIDGKVMGRGKAGKKKKAEQKAAGIAYKKMT